MSRATGVLTFKSHRRISLQFRACRHRTTSIGGVTHEGRLCGRPSRWHSACALCERRAEHRLNLWALNEVGPASAEHDLPGCRVEHFPADIPKHERASPGDFPLEVEADDRVRELIGAVDAPEEVLEHAAIGHRLARHRVRDGLRYATANDEFDRLAALVEEGCAVKVACGVQDAVESVAVEQDLRSRL